MQLQADILAKEVIRPVVRETTALGSAYMAGLASGYWSNLEDLRANWRVDRTFAPSWSAAQRADGYAGWRKAVSKARHWIEE
jgi:glycerol kinase